MGETNENWETKIDKMTHADMARLWRFAPACHPIFDKRNSLFEHFKKRFDKFGGMTTKISKQIGFNDERTFNT